MSWHFLPLSLGNLCPGICELLLSNGNYELIVPWHPIPGILEYLRGIFLQGCNVIKRIDTSQVAGVNDAHEHITLCMRRALFYICFIKEGIFSVEHGLLEGLFANVIVEAKEKIIAAMKK
jgi:hypothetical protein